MSRSPSLVNCYGVVCFDSTRENKVIQAEKGAQRSRAGDALCWCVRSMARSSYLRQHKREQSVLSKGKGKEKGRQKGSAKRVGKGRHSFARRWTEGDDSMTEIDSAKC